MLGSTKGTDLQSIIDAIKGRKINAEVSLVISNVSESGILARAKENNIPAKYIPSKGRKKNEFENEAIEEIRKIGQVDIMMLIGFMKILSREFCKEYEWKIVNVHPSLLPEFAGGMDLNVHEEVIKAGKKKTGCTVHYVIPEVDQGGIIIQSECELERGETPESLKKKVQALEGEALMYVIL